MLLPTRAQVCTGMSIDLYFYCFIYIYNIYIFFLKESLQKLPSHLAKQRLNNQRRCPGARYPRGLIEQKWLLSTSTLFPSFCDAPGVPRRLSHLYDSRNWPVKRQGERKKETRGRSNGGLSGWGKSNAYNLKLRVWNAAMKRREMLPGTSVRKTGKRTNMQES